MSFSAVASYNSSDLFSQNCEELGADFFDQFLTFSPVASETLDYLNISDEHSGTSLDSADDEARDWQGESWVLPQDESYSTQGNALYAELSGRAAISDSGLLSLEGITLDSPQIAAHAHNSVPSSPSPTATLLERRKKRFVESLSKTVRRATGGSDKTLQSPIRKATLSPKMKLENWRQKLTVDASKFCFDFEQPIAPLSPPSSGKIPDVFENSTLANNKARNLDGFSARSIVYDTPLSTPPLGTHATRSVSFQQRSSGPLYSITPQQQSVSASWSQLPGSSGISSYQGSTLYPADIEAPIWWNHAATTPMAQPSPTGYHANPQQATKSLAIHLQNRLPSSPNEFDPSLMASGLMIQMPDTTAQQSFVMGTSPMMRPGYFTAPRSQPHYNGAHRHRQHAPSRQPQSSMPMRNRRSGSSDSESPSPSFHVRKRKSPKTNKHSTPRTASASGAVDFVNYTPHDSKKILTGVAPSGSSKTKARREKEALEKRRKLSQAAVRAVREAGGDVESLVEQGLFV